VLLPFDAQAANCLWQGAKDFAYDVVTDPTTYIWNPIAAATVGLLIPKPAY